MKNHLIIGLGGTGGRVIRALRKRIMMENRSHDIIIPKTDGQSLGLGYLYVDSSAELMKPSDESWRVLGQSVQLPQSAQLLISGANIRSVLENISAYPTLRPWIGSQEQWAKVPETVISAGAGGQRRRLGRFLFAMKASDFSQHVGRVVEELRQKTGNANVHVHVITGLAGGTGGGSFIDALTILAGHPSLGGESRISLFAVLPEQNTTWNAGNYHANGYAALQELNGLLIRKYAPHHLLTGRPVELDLQKIRGVYLISNENDDGVFLNVERDVPVMISDFLYERLLESELGQSPIATNENHDFGPECVLGTQVPERARMFSSFGIKRVEYPESEIEEYLAATLAKMVSCQLTYNNWTDEFGFIDRKVQVNYRQRVEESDVLRRWCLTDDHVRYILPILDADLEQAQAQQWRPTFVAEWQEAIGYYQGQCKDLDKIDMLPKYLEFIEQQFSEKNGFRGVGVPEFYRLRGQGRTAIATRIVELIEDELLRKWREGLVGWSLDDLVETLKSLRESLEERRTGLDGSLASLRQRIQSLEEEIGEQNDYVASVSFLTWPLRKNQILQNHALVLQDYIVARTDLEATMFAVSLIPAVVERVTQLQNEVAEVRSLLAAALERLQRMIDSRLRQDELGAAAIRRFDPQVVGQVRDKMLRDRLEMGRVATDVRASLLDTPLLKNTPRFASLLQELAGVALDQRLLSRCDAMTRSVHDAQIQFDANRVLGVQLIQRLRTDFGGDEERLDAFCRDLVTRAKPFVRLNRDEVGQNALAVGAPVGAEMATALVVQRPRPSGYEDFVQVLDTSLRRTALHLAIPDPSTAKPNALTVISVYAGLPARYLAVTSFLREEYKNRLEATVDLARLEVHTQDDALDLPDLMVANGPPANALSYLLLGQALNIVYEDKNPQTGRMEVVLEFIEQGFKQIDKIANTMKELPDALEQRDYLRVKGLVEEAIKKTLVHEDNKRDLFQKVIGLVNAIGDSEGQRSERYVQFREAGVAAKRILGMEG